MRLVCAKLKGVVGDRRAQECAAGGQSCTQPHALPFSNASSEAAVSLWSVIMAEW